MNIWTRHAISLLLLMLGLSVLTASWLYQSMWSQYEKALTLLEPRIERHLGLIRASAEISAAKEGLGTLMKGWVHPGGAQSPNDLQQQFRQHVTAAGLTLVASQVVTDNSPDGALARIRFSATVTGEWASALVLFSALQSQTPPLWVKSVVLNRETGTETAEPQTVRMTLQLEAPALPDTGGGK